MSGSVSGSDGSGGSDQLAGLQQQSLGQYQQEEAQEIQFNMQMQKLQAEGKMADKASGAQVGG